MMPKQLEIAAQPSLPDGRMILAFSGWMDGGNVSTGTVEWLTKTLNAREVARIAPQDFYILSFPGSMELAAMFRPYTRIEDGLIKALVMPENRFFCSEANRVVLFAGREPNFNWDRFAECLFDFAARCGVTQLYFVGSVAGAVPHSREPRLRSTVSEARLKATLRQYGVAFTDYQGPASFSTQLIHEAPGRGFQMASLVAEIPAYIQGTNPKSIEAVVRKLAAILQLRVPLSELRALSAAWEERLNQILEQKPDLAAYIRKLEEDYDNEVFDTQMGDLKEWLQQQGIRVD